MHLGDDRSIADAREKKARETREAMIAGQEAARCEYLDNRRRGWWCIMMDMKGAIAAIGPRAGDGSAGKAGEHGKTQSLGRHHTLHAIGDTFAEEGFVGTKDLGACQRLAAPLRCLILFDSHNGFRSKADHRKAAR